jgi:hypothetical protein
MIKVLLGACYGLVAGYAAVGVSFFAISRVLLKHPPESDFGSALKTFVTALIVGPLISSLCGAWLGWNRRKKT